MNQSETRKCTGALDGKVDGERLSVEDQLYAIHQVRVLLDHEEEKAIRRGRADGMTWAWIGEIYGTTRQAAQQRWGHVDE